MWEVIMLLLVFIVVIGLAYYVTKKLASLGALRMQGKNMEVIESLQLGINQSIHLVKIGEKILVVSATKDNVSFLSEVTKESIDLSAYENTSDALSFEDYFKKMIKKDK